MLAVLGDVRLHSRQFPDLGTARLANSRQLRSKSGRAAWTVVRKQLDLVIDPLGRHERTAMAFVARLAARLSTAGDLGWLGRSRGWVRGRRLGGVTRALAEFGLEVAHFGLEFLDLVTLGLHDIEQAQEGQPNRFRGRSPILWWDPEQVEWLLVHRRKNAIRRPRCQPPVAPQDSVELFAGNYEAQDLAE
jgi:hypothetical protein